MPMTVSKLQLVQYVHFSLDEIKWQETDAGYSGVLGDVTLFVAGGELTVTMLTFAAGGEKYVIYEPMLLEEAPLGKWMSAFRKHILRQAPRQLSADVQASLRLKKMIAEISAHASKQIRDRYKDPQYDRKLRRRIWDKLTGDQAL